MSACPSAADRLPRVVLGLILLAVALLTPDVAWASAGRTSETNGAQ